MSSPRPLEEQLLAPALRILSETVGTLDAQLEVLEGVASLLGGFSLTDYRQRFNSSPTMSDQHTLELSRKLLSVLKSCPIPPELALCALARPKLTEAEQRTSGAYYTDFRLAQQIASQVAERLVSGAQVIDPAAGTGILLVAASLVACDSDRRWRASWLAESITAWDLSHYALRGARLALASLTDDLSAVQTMVSRWRCHDSLLVENAPYGKFDVVLGNPPWEKIKLTRHEFLRAHGGSRHYGDDYGNLDGELFTTKRNDVARYGDVLTLRYPLIGRGEADLYKAFLELFLRLARPEGCISVLVPAGLIRSHGTENLRQFLFEHANDLSFTIMDNRARFFAIDTRFKFLGLSLTKAKTGAERGDLCLIHASGTDFGVTELGRAWIDRNVLKMIRPNLTIPEVRSAEEWHLFRTMSEHGSSNPEQSPLWEMEIVREVDMTRDRNNFTRVPETSDLPLIEGRMIHQHRFGAKAYQYGTGRRAKWNTVSSGKQDLSPQFWYPEHRLSHAVRKRIRSVRAGFCDIAGQTNERTMLAALIPPGVVCGNKVPTVTFPNDTSEDRLLLWLAIVNSISFDWALRRIVTTTVNYFVLKSVPFPQLQPDSALGVSIIKATRELYDLGFGAVPVDAWRIAKLRASIDVTVHVAYDLDFQALEHMLRDFPLLDRGQPPLNGEERSTVTRDFLLVEAAAHFKEQADVYSQRLQAAREAGAVPYIPSEFTSVQIDSIAR